MKKKRIDLLLVERGFFPTRARAQRAVLAGLVFCDGKRIDKPGTLVDPGAALEVRGDPCPYVSRGGLKLEAALREFGVQVAGKTVLDAGAGTGGFTQCLLEHGARRVWAVDVGYGQLAWELRQDPRVVVKERTNLRYLKPEDLGEKVDLVTLDLSFISLTKVLPAVKELLRPGGEVVALIKPQFEAGRAFVEKGGVVRDKEVHARVLEEVLAAARGLGFRVRGVTFSPLLGADGNIEFFAWLALGEGEEETLDARAVVARAHARFFGAKDGG